MLITQLPLLDDLLAQYAGALGPDLLGYRHHAYRVVNLCAALSSREPLPLEKMAIVAAFHDLGIWTAHTFDYLEPSIVLARDYLARANRSDWSPEIETTIIEHHKIRSYHAQPTWLVEPFRKADLIDVSRGTLKFGLSRNLIRELYNEFPSAGFHRRLLALSMKRLRSHPLSPWPMIRV